MEVELQQIHEEMNQTWIDVSGESLGQVRLERDGKESSAWQFRLYKTLEICVLPPLQCKSFVVFVNIASMYMIEEVEYKIIRKCF